MKIRDLGKKEETPEGRISLAIRRKPCGNNSNGTRAPILPLHSLMWSGLVCCLLSILPMADPHKRPIFLAQSIIIMIYRRWLWMNRSRQRLTFRNYIMIIYITFESLSLSYVNVEFTSHQLHFDVDVVILHYASNFSSAYKSSN